MADKKVDWFAESNRYAMLLAEQEMKAKVKHVTGREMRFTGGDVTPIIANGVTVQKWIPVTERLPEEDGDYLVAKKIFNNTIRQEVLSFAKDGRKVDKYDFHRGWKNVWYRYDSEWGHLTIDDVTHWMPLPEPPKGE